MSTHATAKFEIKSWEEKPYDEIDGKTKLTRASTTQLYSGDIEGEGASESLMFYRADGSATYLGFERIVGRLGDRSGSFVVQATGTYADGKAATNWSVVDGSGTGDLTGLSGTGGFVAVHGDEKVSVTLDFELG